MACSVRIVFFGGFHLVSSTGGRLVVRSKRHQALLAWLLIHRDRPTSRVMLAEAFWPDTTEVQARTNLRNLIYSLRRAVPGIGDWADLDSPAPALHPGQVESDLIVFNGAIDRAREADAEHDWPGARQAYAQVIAVYAGDVLPELDDPWLDSVRESYREAYRQALERLVALHEQVRSYGDAVAIARRLLDLEPYEEPTAVDLVRLQVLSGDRAAARTTWAAFTERFSDELGLVVDSSSHETVHRMLEGDVADRDIPAAVPLVGREEEWNRLRDAFRTAMDGRPMVAVVTGEAGIGKTRLAEELLGWARRQGVRVAEARAFAAEAGISYGPAAEWMRSPALRASLLALDDTRLMEIGRMEIGRIVPDVADARPGLSLAGPMTEGWQRNRLFDAMTRAVVQVDPPVMLFLDDLQWCDGETLEWLHALMRSPDATWVMVLATFRDGEMRERRLLHDLFLAMERREMLVRVPLGPLDQGQTATLASIVGDGSVMPEPVAERFYTETEGSPLFIVEMARAGLGADRRGSSAPETLEGPDALPPTVLAAIHSRLVNLSSSAMEAARMAAVLERPFASGMLSAAMEASELEALDALDELAERRLLREDDRGMFSYTHDKVRQVVYGTLGPARRQAAHRQAAVALASMQGRHRAVSSGVVAMHYECAGNGREAGRWYMRAGNEARVIFADADAERLYLQAAANLNGVDGTDEEAAAYVLAATEALADVRHRLGRQEQSLAGYLDLLERVGDNEAVDRARIHRKISRLHRLQRRVDEADEHLIVAMRELEQSQRARDDTWWSEWINTSLEQVHVAYFDGRVADLAALLPGIEEAVERYGSPAQRGEIGRSQLQHAFLTDRYTGSDATLQLARERHARSQSTGIDSAIASTSFALGFALLQRRDAGACDQLERALENASRIGDLELEARCLIYLAVEARLRGDAARVAGFLERVERVIDVIGLPEYRAASLANRAWIVRREGRLLDAERLATDAAMIWEEGGVYYPFRWLAYMVLLAVAAVAGDETTGADAAGVMLRPSQQRLSPAMEHALEQALAEPSRATLLAATREAEAAGYL